MFIAHGMSLIVYDSVLSAVWNSLYVTLGCAITAVD